jgi:hypothetical protein
MSFNTVVAGVSATSYTTLAAASTYFSQRLFSTAWTAAASALQETALMHASRTLDEWVDWKGYRATEEQNLRWPRYSVYDRDGYSIDSDIIPNFLQDATAELALYLMQSDRTAEPDTKGFRELQVGSMKLVIDKDDRDSVTVLPDSVIAIIEYYGEPRSRNDVGFVKLERA